MYKSGQCAKRNPSILTGTMAKNILQVQPKQPALDALKGQQQLARVVSRVVSELERGTTQAVLEVIARK